MAADPDAFAGVDAVDAEQLSGGGAEYGDGFLGGSSVEVVALGDVVARTGRRSRDAAWTVRPLVSTDGM
ncbi:MAG: hypothetical protein JOY89_12195 [Solirubrobacterales bacterium]|nr:hypothetical protein [Solirubrobacterales bacterium]